MPRSLSRKAPSIRGPSPSTAPGWAISKSTAPRSRPPCRWPTSPSKNAKRWMNSSAARHCLSRCARWRGARGPRVRKEVLYVRVNGRNLADIVRGNIAEAQEFFLNLNLSPEETAIAEKILVEIRQRLKFLNDVGLEYLTLDRLANTLSGGEAQRIQLATSLGSRLVGTCYVLDEPSIGLHSRDTGRLIRILEELRGLGN